MHQLLSGVIGWLQGIAGQVPLELFALLGGFVEEIVAPIPSPVIATLVGSIAAAQSYTWPEVALVCAIGCIGKTLGAWVFYAIGYVFEGVVVSRYGKYIGVSHSEIEQFGRRFTGGWKDAVVLFLIRSIPMMPSTPVTLACGIVRLRTRTFLITTYLGFFVREMFFVVLGYSGVAATSLLAGINSAESAINGLIALAIFIGIAWLYWRRRKGTLLSLLVRNK
ncbi:MAG TPA: VTT domain-containing protein [Candidatus Peribacteria bacterium]|nr:VTT domain-containing protein [Candidatus Peribacteria bacterium]